MCAGAALLRLPGLSTDLWLDELWSLDNALDANSWQDLLLHTRIDNNHHLNSLYLYWIGPEATGVVYRLLAFVSGVGAVATAWLVGGRQSRLTGLVAATVFGGSYLIAFYASEARGYATVVWLTLAAWYCVERYTESPRHRWVGAFAVCSLLGVMAHQTFVIFLLGAYFWADARLQRGERSLRAATRATWWLFTPAVALVAAFYLVALRGQEIGGGPPYRLAPVVAQTLSAVSGGPLDGPGLWVVGALVAIVFVGATWRAGRAGDERWLLYAAAGLVIPALLLLVQQPTVLVPRYFIVPASVLLVATSRWLSEMLRRGGIVRAMAVVLIAGHLTGGVLHLTSTAASRGEYSDALARIVELGATTVASSDRYSGHDFRTSLLVHHYRRALGVEDRVRYVTTDEYPETGVDAVIVESLGEPPEPSISDPLSHAFELVDTYPAGDLSGTTWYLYRRVAVDDRADER